MGTPTPISCSVQLQSNTVYKIQDLQNDFSHALLNAAPT